MLPMFLGTLTLDGNLDTTHAYSGKFNPSRSGQAFAIQLGEWIALAPTVMITGVDVSGNMSKYPSYWVTQSNNQYTINVKMHDHAKGDGPQPFSFVAMVGSTIVYPVQSATDQIVLTPEILPFGAGRTDTLVLKTTIGGTTYYLDQGTVLLADVDAKLASTTLQFRGGSLSGYTVAWYANETESSQPTALRSRTVTTPPVGTRTALTGLTCVATSDTGGAVLTTDPIVIVRTKGSTSA